MAYNNTKRKKFSSTIIVEDNNVNRAISALKHLVAPMLKELKQKRYFEKPSEKKRRKRKESDRKMRKRIRLLEQDW